MTKPERKEPRMCKDCKVRYAQELGRCRRCWRTALGEPCMPSPNPLGRGARSLKTREGKVPDDRA